jgi:hypothetical protein
MRGIELKHQSSYYLTHIGKKLREGRRWSGHDADLEYRRHTALCTDVYTGTSLDTQNHSLLARTALFSTTRRLLFMLSLFRLPCVLLVPYSVIYLFSCWDSVVGIATSYGLDDRGVGIRDPVGSRIFSSTRRPDKLWGPPSLLSYWYRGLFTRE